MIFLKTGRVNNKSTLISAIGHARRGFAGLTFMSGNEIAIGINSREAPRCYASSSVSNKIIKPADGIANRSRLLITTYCSKIASLIISRNWNERTWKKKEEKEGESHSYACTPRNLIYTPRKYRAIPRWSIFSMLLLR